MRDPLTAFEHKLILTHFPQGSTAVGSMSFPGHNKRYPLRVTVTLPDGREETVVLRQDDKPGGSHLESQLLPVLHRLGLPVPQVLAGPTVDPTHPDSPAKIVFSLLTGTDLLRSCWDTTSNRLDFIAETTLDAIDRLHALTEAVTADPVAKIIPRHSLADELKQVRQTGGRWTSHPLFAEALERVTPAVETIETPLVFSTGDYNPGNFLTDGETVTGYVDFAWTCFQDPYVGITRYWLNEWYPLNKVGIVERYLFRHNVPRTEFAPRLVVRALAMLQNECIPVDPKNDPTRDKTLELLKLGLAGLQ
ncbi:MAG TPA: phosphotransferase [Tepidisphaeraceae bacterium]|jgi:aminoglycoside phosphotransferase (APT) family kinase protein|nr:phosphotransferase [Tepidisphaeraceae bacterium]